MPWIESHTELEDHPKLLVLKSRMRWSKNETVGFLHRFWWTVLKYAPNGVISALPLEVVSETLDMKREDLDKAMENMRDVGLLDERSGLLVVHDWPFYAGTYLRGSKYRRQPDKWKEVEQVYGLSCDCRETVDEQSRVPHQPHQPNQPTTPAEREADRVAEARRDAVSFLTLEATQYLRNGKDALEWLILKLGRERAFAESREMLADKSIGNPFPYLRAKYKNGEAREVPQQVKPQTPQNRKHIS